MINESRLERCCAASVIDFVVFVGVYSGFVYDGAFSQQLPFKGQFAGTLQLQGLDWGYRLCGNFKGWIYYDD